MIRKFYLFSFFFSFFAPPVYGFINMELDGYFLQIIIAGILGFLFTLRTYVKELKSKITGLIKKSHHVVKRLNND